jgi:hypothetical protein
MHKRNNKNSLDVKLLTLGSSMALASMVFLGKGFYNEIIHENFISEIQERQNKRKQRQDLWITGGLLLGSVGLLGVAGARYFMRLQKEYSHKDCDHKHEHGEEECHNPMHTGLH